jgi:hypothetical protein
MPLIRKRLKRDWRRSENTCCPKGCSQGVPSKELFVALNSLLLRFARQI